MQPAGNPLRVTSLYKCRVTEKRASRTNSPNERNERTMNEQARRTETSDLHATHLYLVNGIIVDYWDFEGHAPTIGDVKSNWQYDYYGLNDVSDDEIFRIIEKVRSLIARRLID